METTEQQLTDYLRNKYNPISIILHGSRANGMSRKNSDWDFVILTEKDVSPISREIVHGSNIEIKQIILPVSVDKFIGFFFRIENTKILHDTDDTAQKLMLQNEMFINEGNSFQPVDKMKRKAFFLSALDGIKDYGDNNLILLDKKIDFHTRIVDSWFRFTKKEFEPSHYFAYPQIQKEDPELYFLIEKFALSQKSDELIEIGNKIIDSLFPELVN